jgi:hypothetical protein
MGARENAQKPGPAALLQRQAGPVIRMMAKRFVMMARLLAIAARRIKDEIALLEILAKCAYI